MATRFYFPETEAAAVSPTISAEWEHQNAVRRRLLTTPDASTLTSTAYTPDGADDTTDKDSHHRQYVSDALAAQTIVASTFKIQFQGLEPNLSCNMSLTWKVFICSNDGTTIKETLVAIQRDGTELVINASGVTNRGDSALSVLANLEDGDRLVCEVGVGGTPVSGAGINGHNATLRWGCNASGGDLPENDTETGTTFRPWLDCSQTLTFQSAQSQAPRSMHQYRLRRAG